MKKIFMIILGIGIIILFGYLTREEYNPYFDEEYEALESSSEWHHDYSSSSGNEVFWKNDGSEYFTVEVFGNHHDEFLELAL